MNKVYTSSLPNGVWKKLRRLTVEINMLVAQPQPSPYSSPRRRTSAIGFGDPKFCDALQRSYPVRFSLDEGIGFYGGCAREIFGSAGFHR